MTDKKRVQNAEKNKYAGIQFKSQLETYCYKKLKENRIRAQYETLTFTLMEEFEYKGKKIKKISYTPDFIGNNFIIECKGYKTEVFTLKWKLFKNYLVKHNIEYDLYLPKNHKEVDECILNIKEKRENGVNNSKKTVQAKRRKSFITKLVQNITQVF
jgi:hypothetical protein